MNGMQMPVMADNPYAAEIIAARQRIGRLKDRLAQRAMARRSLTSEKDHIEDSPAADPQVEGPKMQSLINFLHSLSHMYLKRPETTVMKGRVGSKVFLHELSVVCVQQAEVQLNGAADTKSATLPLQQMIARHLLDPNITIPTDNAKLRSVVRARRLPTSLSYTLLNCSSRR